MPSTYSLIHNVKENAKVASVLKKADIPVGIAKSRIVPPLITMLRTLVISSIRSIGQSRILPLLNYAAYLILKMFHYPVYQKGHLNWVVLKAEDQTQH